MRSCDLIHDIITVLSEISNRDIDNYVANKQLSKLIEKIDYRLKLIKAEELGIFLISSENGAQNELQQNS